MSKIINKKTINVLQRKNIKIIKARKGSVKMLYYPAGNGCNETTILYSDKFKLQFAQTNISEYEMDCDYCETGGPYSTSLGLQYHIPPNPEKGHIIEVVCHKCGRRYLLKPVLHVHYELIADSDDDNYVPLKKLFDGE